jgi:hypothetical protein
MPEEGDNRGHFARENDTKRSVLRCDECFIIT